MIVGTAIGISAMILVATGVLVAFRAPAPWAPALAVLRGAVQLAAISLILSGVIRDARWVVVALIVMFTVATLTSTRRIGGGRAHFGVIAGAMAAGIVVTLGIVFGSGTLAPTARFLLALGGIIIGNSMSIATLAGRRFLEAAEDRWDDVEGWLALGATRRQSTIHLARRALHSALIPSIDQTKTTGLVTLPGAFVGAIFGGLSPLDAGRFQLVVLAGIMCAGTVTGAIVIAALAPLAQKPVPLR